MPFTCADDEKTIRKKVMRAVTDTGPTHPGQEMTEPVKNLFTIMKFVSGPDTIKTFQGAVQRLHHPLR
jgi:tryptophanyl-tRNA synthetase